MRWRSFGNFKSPAVIRVAGGGYLQGGGVYHSQSGAALFAANPGLRVVCPATADLIAAADEHGIAMVFTVIRHFRH